MYLRDTIAVDMRLLGCGDMLRAYRLYIVYHTCGALSREFFYRLAVGLLSAAGTRMPWHPVPSRAACTYLRAGALTCSLPIKLRLLISYVFIIRNRRLALVVCFGFFNEEYLIAPVDFIVALRRTKGRGRRTLRSPPSPSSGLHLIHPGVSASAGHICCRGLYQFR